MATGHKITGSQVRMGRAALRWSLLDLAERAGLNYSTLRAIEAADDVPEISAAGVETTREWRAGSREETMGKIAAAFTAAGVTFLADDGSGAGIRCKPKTKGKGKAAK